MADVTVYTRQFCGYCSAAKRLLGDKAVAFTEIDATFSRKLRREMTDRSGRMTFPQIFIGTHHVGGFDDLSRLERRGALDELLAAEDA